MKWLILLAALFFAGPAAAAICTDGTDCYCDCVVGPVVSPPGYKNSACEAKGIPVDTSNIMCEDFEAEELDGTTPATGSFGNGAPDYGPWYDATGASGYRGFNSYWARNYGGAVPNCLWQQNEPASPNHGAACTAGGQGCAQMEWSFGSQATNLACMDMMENGEFDDEKGDNAEPLIPGGGQGVFDGSRSKAHRVPASIGPSDADTGGIHGAKNWSSVTEIGVALAYAFPSDIEDSGAIAVSWKTNEFKHSQQSDDYEYMGIGTNTNRNSADDLPLALFRWTSNCTAATASMVVNEGEAYCVGSGILAYNPVQSGGGNTFTQDDDAPYGTWGCAQSYMEGVGTSDHRIRVWHNGVLMIDIDHLDGTQFRNLEYSRMVWNNYANANQENTGGTTEIAYRYEDNVHIREGEPYSCEQLGFNLDNEPEPSAGTLALSAATYTVAEGDTNLVVTVARTGGTDGAVTAEISTAQTGVAEVYEDWTPDPVQVSFGNGVGGTTTANIPITADALDEDAETFTISLGSPTGGATIGAIDDAVVTITDDDDTPTLSISDATAAESNNGSFIVTLSAESGRTVTVNVNSSNGTAIGTVDFTPVVASTLTYTPGQTSKAATVTVTNDALDENSETYTMTLSGASNATLEDATGAGVITDNDSPPTVTLAANPLVMAEAGGTSTVYAELSAPSGLDVTVPLIFDGSSATLTTDYTRSGTSISIPGNVGNTVGSITLTAVQDVALETGELVRVRVSPDPTNATLTGDGDVTVDITDDDILPPPIEPYSTPVLLNAN